MEKPHEAALMRLQSRAYAGTVLGVLLLVYTSNFIDRTILGTLGQAVKDDLGISDTQLGLLQGFAFAVLYTLLGIPLARLAERRSRVGIISICLFVWSGFTALCGMAQNFAQLLLYRIGVGIGEAGCSPAAHSLITDYFPAQRRATALSIYSFGVPLGTMIGAVAGGYIAQTFGWRQAFLIVGLPGIVLAVVTWIVVREPQRGQCDPIESRPLDTAPPAPLGAVVRRLAGCRSFRHMACGATLISFAAYGGSTFLAPYFLRSFALDYAQVGLIYGLIAGLGAGAGTLLGGRICDRIGEREPKWYALFPGLTLLLATPLYLLAWVQDTWTVAAGLLLVAAFLHYMYLGPTFGVMHNLVDARMRATATALLLFVINFVGLGGGPLFTGWLIDLFSAQAFAPFGFGEFLTSCPGGRAPQDSGPELLAACRESLERGTRGGQFITHAIIAWAAVHFLLGARWLRGDLARAG
ncbi:MAG TPA: MFS transporter [Steroidobacteraceae bacterium]|nr:MFS transporter [Steroidobacteraceae bacterium]HNS26496.1 MFS transporter [Steroidobacteraceae bacterium]